MSNDAPKKADEPLVLEEKRNEWVCCVSCGRRLFYAYYIPVMNIQVKCGRCNKTIRIVVGQITID